MVLLCGVWGPPLHVEGVRVARGHIQLLNRQGFCNRETLSQYMLDYKFKSHFPKVPVHVYHSQNKLILHWNIKTTFHKVKLFFYAQIILTLCFFHKLFQNVICDLAELHGTEFCFKKHFFIKYCKILSLWREKKNIYFIFFLQCCKINFH